MSTTKEPAADAAPDHPNAERPHPAGPYAFRCSACGHLEHPDHAGDQAVPIACRVCGAGQQWGQRGQWTHDPDNWEVLSHASGDRLAELGLTRGDVIEHQGKGKPGAPGQPKTAALTDGARVADKG